MRSVLLCTPAPGDPARLARLVRHLQARLGDLGPNSPEIGSADPKTGRVLARFPGHSSKELVQALARDWGVHLQAEGDCVLFQLSPQTSFEDLDYVWGSLFALLS